MTRTVSQSGECSERGELAAAETSIASPMCSATIPASPRQFHPHVAPQLPGAGLKILSVYMSGSKNMSYDSASLTTPDIKWLGVRPSDLDRYKVSSSIRTCPSRRFALRASLSHTFSPYVTPTNNTFRSRSSAACR